MENAPHIVILGRNIPPNIEQRYLEWYDAAYAPNYVKLVGGFQIDRYQILKENLEYPRSVTIYHMRNRNTVEKIKENPVRLDMQRDMDATFYTIEWSWHDVYILVRSYTSNVFTPESTIVENAPVIHLEGYQVPISEQRRYDQWFMRWASRVYIPLLVKNVDVKAYNSFKFSDLSMRYPSHNYIGAEIPSYVSIIYFENLEACERFTVSLENTVFKRELEREFPGNLNTIWDVEYQLVKSWRK